MDMDNTIHRRRLVGGAFGAALAASAAAGLGIAAAQEDPATPDASTGSTSEAGVATTDLQDRAEAITTAIERATTVISEVAADRESIAGQIDTSTIDELLDQASGFRDRAETSVDSEDEGEPLRLAEAAVATARVAGELLRARLGFSGLPSQEAPASRTLAAAFDQITTDSREVETASDADIEFFVTTARSLYGEAYDLYDAAAFNQASETAETAAHAVSIAWLLARPAVALRMGGVRGIGGFERDAGHRNPMGDGGTPRRDVDAPSAEPVTVPAPEF